MTNGLGETSVFIISFSSSDYIIVSHVNRHVIANFLQTVTYPSPPLAHPADDVNAKNSCWLTQFSHDLLLSINGRFSLP